MSGFWALNKCEWDNLRPQHLVQGDHPYGDSTNAWHLTRVQRPSNPDSAQARFGNMANWAWLLSGAAVEFREACAEQPEVGGAEVACQMHICHVT